MTRDLRLPMLALASWGGALLGSPGMNRGVGAGLVVVALVWSLVTARVTAGGMTCWKSPGAPRRSTRPAINIRPGDQTSAAPQRRKPSFLVPGVAVLGVLVLAVVGWSGAALRAAHDRQTPLLRLAEQRAQVLVEVVVTGDPHSVQQDRVMVPVSIRQWQRSGPSTPRGATGGVASPPRTGWRGREPAVLWGDPNWLRLRLGERWQLTARLQVGESIGLAPLGPGRRTRAAGWGWQAAAAVRAGVREAAGAQDSPAETAGYVALGRALVPAMIDGDDASIPPGVTDEFRAAGLTHLLVVSGANLTILLAFLLAVARTCGVRGRWLLVVGLLGVLAFVALARGEPSVVRAATMGVVGVLALGQRNPRRGLGVLSGCVLVLVLAQPNLAAEPGFALSVCATAGILLWAPGWQETMARRLETLAQRPGRLPRTRWLIGWSAAWVPAALAIPVAAQLACTPVVAALSGQVSVVAVIANLAAAPVVGPVTVSGFVGGLVAVAWPFAGQLLAVVAVLGAGWIVWVADRAAHLPGATMEVDTSTGALLLLTGVCTLLLAVLWWAARRMRRMLSLVLLMALVVAVPLPTPGWPPPDWIVAACDVGQGDALLLNMGAGSAVMVDAGPDPDAASACLRRFDVDRVPLFVVTHFHADHVNGFPGVADRVQAVVTTQDPDPAEGELLVRAAASARSLPLSVATAGTHRWGQFVLQVLPSDPRARNPNDASVVLAARFGEPGHEVNVLLTGDLGRAAQQWFEPGLRGFAVDVLKVAHHGSKDTDLAWMQHLRPRIALISVGAENTYGHPAPEVVSALAGARVGRTDRDGDLAVVNRPDGVQLLHR